MSHVNTAQNRINMVRTVLFPTLFHALTRMQKHSTQQHLANLKEVFEVLSVNLKKNATFLFAQNRFKRFYGKKNGFNFGTF